MFYVSKIINKTDNPVLNCFVNSWPFSNTHDKRKVNPIHWHTKKLNCRSNNWAFAVLKRQRSDDFLLMWKYTFITKFFLVWETLCLSLVLTSQCIYETISSSGQVMASGFHLNTLKFVFIKSFFVKHVE